MADIRTQLTSEDGTDNLFPVTKAVNVTTNSGTNVEGELGTIKSKMETMTSSITQASTKADNATTAVSAMQSTITTLTNRVTVVESTVENLDGIRYEVVQ